MILILYLLTQDDLINIEIFRLVDFVGTILISNLLSLVIKRQHFTVISYVTHPFAWVFNHEVILFPLLFCDPLFDSLLVTNFSLLKIQCKGS